MTGRKRKSAEIKQLRRKRWNDFARGVNYKLYVTPWSVKTNCAETQTVRWTGARK